MWSVECTLHCTSTASIQCTLFVRNVVFSGKLLSATTGMISVSAVEVSWNETLHSRNHGENTRILLERNAARFVRHRWKLQKQNEFGGLIRIKHLEINYQLCLNEKKQEDKKNQQAISIIPTKHTSCVIFNNKFQFKMFGSSRSLLFPTPQHSTESQLLRDIGISTIHQISFRLSTINQDNNLAMLGGGKEKKNSSK